MPAFQRRVCWTWIIGPSQRSNAKSKPGFQWVDLVTLPKTGISVSALRWLRCLLTRRQPILGTTQWSMCVCAWRTGTVSCGTSPSSIWRRMMQTGEEVQIERHRWPEREKKGAEKEEEVVWEEASGERDLEFLMNQVDFQQGLFSFWCILLHTWVLWSCFFFCVFRHKK